MSPALLVTAAVVLLVSGVAHVLRHASTRAFVLTHDVLPRWSAGPVVALLTACELLLGVGLLAAVLLGRAAPQEMLGLGAAALFLALAGYAHLAWRVRPETAPPCACGVGETPMGPWVTLRAVLLAGLTAAGALSVGDGAVAGRPWSEVVILLCATLALSSALTYLPAARALLAPLTLRRSTS
jgi:hypothetical protein